MADSDDLAPLAGHPEATEALSRCYALGRGVVRNPRHAEALLRCARDARAARAAAPCCARPWKEPARAMASRHIRGGPAFRRQAACSVFTAWLVLVSSACLQQGEPSFTGWSHLYGMEPSLRDGSILTAWLMLVSRDARNHVALGIAFPPPCLAWRDILSRCFACLLQASRGNPAGGGAWGGTGGGPRLGRLRLF
jgi:hypothetical protein